MLADIHANLTALEAVLRDLESRGGVDEIWCLGDVVGYGPDPRQCISLVQQYCSCCIAGNHDWAAAGLMDTSGFNQAAAAAAQWTRRQLNSSETGYLAGLPQTLERDKFTLAHGSPRYPLWEYILSLREARANFPFFHTPFCLIGHSHIPLFFRMEGNPGSQEGSSDTDDTGVFQQELYAGCQIDLGERRAIINPGGVGQPRDNDPRASYGLIDSGAGTFTLLRLSYDIPDVQARMAAAGLPGRLIERLAYGW
ncbi:MAG: metallophosphoesterase family protein [Dehalococcoidales bacterium]|nr:metallophosphoesterase family protein [Dehalococcoidales bacterium]